MKHKIKLKKLSRNTKHRLALLRNLSKSLIKHNSIKTTLIKAKVMRRFVEKLITRSKINTIHNRRIILSKIGEDKNTTYKLFKIIGPKYHERPGGYTRIIKTGFRKGDCAPMAIIELVK